MCPENQCWAVVANEKTIRPINSECTNEPLCDGSEDLNFIPPHLLMSVLEIYDCCLRMRNVLRLAPFRLEDFCFCLVHQGQSPLIAEVFLAYLRVLFIDDENNGITYFSPNEKDYAYIFSNAIDNFTWVEAVKTYFNSSSALLPLYRSVISKAGFPMSSSIDDKVSLLKALHSNFIQSSVFTTSFAVDSLDTSDKCCKSCKKPGILESCSICTNVYHKECLVNVRFEQQNLICASCCEHSINGLSYEDLYYRYTRMDHTLKPIGMDHCGRLYWFTARRVFVEDSSGKVTYYSSVAAVNKLVTYLTSDSATNEQLIAYLSSNDVTKEVSRNSIIIKFECSPNYTPIYQLDSMDTSTEDKNAAAISLKGNKYYFIGMNDGYLRYSNYYNCSSEYSALWHPTLSKKLYNSQMLYHNLPWHGGFEQLYRDIVELRKCNGASYRVIHEFAFLKLIQNTLITMESLLPSPYLNPIWYHQLPAWAKCVRLASSPAKLAALILLFYHMIKPFTFQLSWYESSGHLLPCKVICPDAKVDKAYRNKAAAVLVRNFQNYEFAKYYNDVDELVNVDVIVKEPRHFKSSSSTHKHATAATTNTFVKFKKVPQHRVWNQKGEEYRLTGETSWYLINSAQSKNVLSKLTQSVGSLDRVMDRISARNNPLMAAATTTATSNTTVETHTNVLPSLAPVGASSTNNATLSTNDNRCMPGEPVSQYFLRKGSPLLKSIEQGLMSSGKPLITNPDKLIARELKHFVHRRQEIANMCDVLRVYRICASERIRLGRKAGLVEVKGFNYNNSSCRSPSTLNWPMCFPRPSIGRIWEIRMLSVSSIFDIVYLTKVFHTCLDLNHLNNSTDSSGANEIVVGGINLRTTPIYCSQIDEGIVTEEILDARSISSDGLSYEYLVKKTLQPLSKLANGTNYLVDNQDLVLNKDGEIAFLSKSRLDSGGIDDDGRYVSSFRKSSVPPENLVNEHVLRSSYNKSKLLYKHTTTNWLHENEINTILIKRFWAKVEEERTRLQTEYALQHKKWLHMAATRSCSGPTSTPLLSNVSTINSSVALTSSTINKSTSNNGLSAASNNPLATTTTTTSKHISTTDSLIGATLSNNGTKLPNSINNTIPPHTPLEHSGHLLPSTNPTPYLKPLVSNPYNKYVSPSQVNLTNSKQLSLYPLQDRNKLNKEPQPLEMSYENMVIYQQIKEEKLRIKPKIDAMYGFKVEELLNAHAEYLKCNLRRNGTLSTDVATPYQSYIDVREQLNERYSHDDYIIGKFVKSSNKAKISFDNVIVSNFASVVGSNDTHFRRSNRAHKPKVPYEELDYFGHTGKSQPHRQSRTSCCCSSVARSTDRTFVSCCTCGNLFHGVCYGISKLKASIVSNFCCPSCELARDDSALLDQKSTCHSATTLLRCRCGVPDFLSRDLIRCQLCGHMSHTDCINFPEEQPNLLNYYFVCHYCRNALLTRIDQDHHYPLSLVGKRVLSSILSQLKTHEVSSPFLLPVDGTIVSDYSSVVKTPMDMSTLAKNLDADKYSNVPAFVSDFVLIFDNCRLYNSKETVYVKFANCLECILLLKLHSLLQRSDISANCH